MADGFAQLLATSRLFGYGIGAMFHLRFVIAFFLCACACLASCPTAALSFQDPDWAAPPLSRATSIVKGRTGERVEMAAMLDDLARMDVVFLGEMHTDETTHRVELAIYEGLLQRRDGKVVLAMEMFERDVQPVLDTYLAGDIDEAAFLAAAHPWGNYRTGYRRLIERARAQALPVIASNFPRSLRRRMAMQGEGVLQELKGEERRLAPAELMPNSPAYWRRVDNAVRGHLGMMGGKRDPDDPRLLDTQSLWDNSMGEACALALKANPGYSVLHINGGFHTEYWDGTVRQLSLRAPEAKVATVAIVPVANPGVALPRGLPVADYVVYAEARANDVHDGTWSVTTHRDLRYRFHLPASASAAQPVPLLIWLSDDGLTGRDGMDLWRDHLGKEVAIAVIEAPYRQVGIDLGESGRWYWADTFQQDIGAMVTGIERAWGYLLRNMPIDPQRVALAGEGTGATVVAATALLGDRTSGSAVALNPRQYAKIKDFPLPLPELLGDEEMPERRLMVWGDDGDREWWSEELAAYQAIGLASEFVVEGEDPWQREATTQNALRSALGLPLVESVSTGSRRYVLVESDSPRARHWARLLALREAQSGSPVAVLTDAAAAGEALRLDASVSANDFAPGGARSLPRCPGPFGGTTVIALPEGIAADELQAWLDLEEEDPLQARSRFHRLRIATATGERSLPAVLARLRERNRNNVLIIPAAFCVDGMVMRALQRSVLDDEDKMTLHWRPGLGGGS